MALEKIEKIVSYEVERNWLYAPSTYLLDSWEPVVEEIHLPKVASKPGELNFRFKVEGSTSAVRSSSIRPKIKQFFSRRVNELVVSDKSTIVDLRAHNPENLAHAITNHLPIALASKVFLNEINERKPLLIFPSKLPKYIKQLFVSAGFELLLTDVAVRGRTCEFNVDPWIAIRGIRHTLIKDGLSNSEFARAILNKGLSLPKKIFIARRGTRCLSNENEVEHFLSAKGYKKVYLEDYDILEQIAMVSLADSIVSIHGAALGPLLLRVLFDLQPIKIVELFSPGHMTNVFRMVCQQTGGKWAGVRGKLWPDIINQAYFCLPKNIRKYSLVEFSVCLLSLDKAMASIKL